MRLTALRPELAARGPIFALYVGNQDVHGFRRAAQHLDAHACDFGYELLLLLDGAVGMGWISEKKQNHKVAPPLPLPALSAYSTLRAHTWQMQCCPRALRGTASRAAGGIRAFMHQQSAGACPCAMAHWLVWLHSGQRAGEGGKYAVIGVQCRPAGRPDAAHQKWRPQAPLA